MTKLIARIRDDLKVFRYEAFAQTGKAFIVCARVASVTRDVREERNFTSQRGEVERLAVQLELVR